jgi:hypothetical protein
MPEQKRTKYLTETSAGGTTLQRYVGNECKSTLFIGWPKGRANQVRDLLNAAYQTGREEVMKELAELAASPGGRMYVAEMLIRTLDEEKVVRSFAQHILDGGHPQDYPPKVAQLAHCRTHLEFRSDCPNCAREQM